MRMKGAGVILHDEDDRILLVLGRKHNKWSFPKGHLDYDDEPLKVCAQRETKEETGLTVSISEHVKTWRHKYIYYLIGPESVVNGWNLNPQDRNEVVDCRWFSRKEMLDLDGNSAVRKYLNFPK